MTEMRHTPRRKSFLRGFVYIDNRSSAVECLVRDISDTGARLICSAPLSATDIIDLHIPIKGQTFSAKVQWREADEIGVTFVSASATGGAPSGDGLSDRVARLEAEVVALKNLVKRLQKNTGSKTEAA